MIRKAIKNTEDIMPFIELILRFLKHVKIKNPKDAPTKNPMKPIIGVAINVINKPKLDPTDDGP
jgi:hypothetical protein